MPSDKKTVSKSSRPKNQSAPAKKSKLESPPAAGLAPKTKRVRAQALGEANVVRLTAGHIEFLAKEVLMLQQRVELLERQNAAHVGNEMSGATLARKPIASAKEAFAACDTFMGYFDRILDLFEEWNSLLKNVDEPDASMAPHALEMVRLYDAASSHAEEGASALSSSMAELMDIVDLHPDVIAVASRTKSTLETIQQLLEVISTKEIDKRLSLLVLAIRIVALQAQEHGAAFLAIGDEIEALQGKIVEGVKYLDESFHARILELADGMESAAHTPGTESASRLTDEMRTDILQLMLAVQEARSLAQTLADTDFAEKVDWLQQLCPRARESLLNICNRMHPLLLAISKSRDDHGILAGWTQEMSQHVQNAAQVADELPAVLDVTLSLMHPLARTDDKDQEDVDKRSNLVEHVVSAANIAVDKADEMTARVISLNYEIKRTSYHLRTSLWTISCHHADPWATKFAEVQASLDELDLALGQTKALAIQTASIANILATIADETQKIGEHTRVALAGAQSIFDAFEKDLRSEQVEKVRYPGNASSVDITVERLNRVELAMADLRIAVADARDLAMSTSSAIRQKVSLARELAEAMWTELGYLVAWSQRSGARA